MNFGLMAQSKERLRGNPIPINQSIIILTVNARASWFYYVRAPHTGTRRAHTTQPHDPRRASDMPAPSLIRQMAMENPNPGKSAICNQQ